MAYGARLESVLGASPRGFESPILRQTHSRNQCMSGDSQLAVEIANHSQGKPTLSVEHFIDSVGIADHRHQVGHGESTLLHAKFDGLNRVWRLNRKMLALIGFYGGCQNVEFVVSRSSRLKVLLHQLVHFDKSRKQISSSFVFLHFRRCGFE